MASGAAELRDAFAARLREELRTGQERGAPAMADARRTYRRAAALLSRFDPQRLRLPDDAGPAGYATLELLDDCTAVGGRASGLWTLKPSVREEVLAGLDGPGTALRLLECNTHQFAGEPGPEQVCLAHLSGRPPDLARQNADELADTLQAVLWLSRVPGVTGLPDAADVTRALDRARLLEPLERLAQGPFLGRTGELRALGAYTGLTAAPAGPEGPAEPGGPTGPLVVHGPGGIGKSTLLARFLLGCVHHLAPGFPFAYIDYERPTLSVHEPITLIAEMARQLGVQYPSHRADLEALADECQEVAGSEREGQERVSQLHRLATTRAVLGRRSSQEFHLLAAERETALMRGVAEVMSRAVTGAGQAGAPFVLVLDSFEEAQYRASPVLGRLWSMYTALCSVYPRTRVLVSGRAPVGHPAQTVASHALELPELAPEAAVGLLESCGVADPELARLLADRVGGHPLSLKLAARAAVLAEASATTETVPGEPAAAETVPGGAEALPERDAAPEQGPAGGALLRDLIGSLPARRRRFFQRVDQMLVQGVLYDRILHHIADDEVRRLAHPGLVLRVITPEIIKDVLAGPCGLRVETTDEAERLFDGLARLDLVEPAGPAALRHRPDVRCIMLRLLGEDMAGTAREVERRAVEYYAAREGLEARAEEIYHRLRLGENPRSVEQRWLPGVEQFLAGAERDMDPRAAGLLNARSGRGAPQTVLDVADQEDWERLAAREIEDLLAQGLAGEAMALLTERRPWTPCSPLHALHAETLDRLGRRAEARTVAGGALGPAGSAGCEERRLELLLLSARLAEQDGDADGADRCLGVAEDTAVRIGHDLEAIGALLARTRLARSRPVEAGASGDGVRETPRDGLREADDRLARRLRALPDAVMADQPELVRAAASQVHTLDPEALGHALDVVGLPADDEVPDVLGAAVRRAVAHRPRLLDLVLDLLGDAAGRPPRPAAPPPSSITELLRLARDRGTLDTLARRLLDVRDESGEIAAGVAAAMELGATGPDRPVPAPWTGPP